MFVHFVEAQRASKMCATENVCVCFLTILKAIDLFVHGSIPNEIHKHIHKYDRYLTLISAFHTHYYG